MYPLVGVGLVYAPLGSNAGDMRPRSPLGSERQMPSRGRYASMVAERLGTVVYWHNLRGQMHAVHASNQPHHESRVKDLVEMHAVRS